MDDTETLVRERPVLAAAVFVLVGALTYATVSRLMRDTINRLEVILFAVVFAAVYLVYSLYAKSIAATLGLE